MEPFFDFVLTCLEFRQPIMKIYKENGKIIANCLGKTQEFDDISLKEILETWIKHEAVTDRFTMLKIDKDRIVEVKGNKIIRKLPNKSFKKLDYDFLVLQP